MQHEWVHYINISLCLQNRPWHVPRGAYFEINYYTYMLIYDIQIILTFMDLDENYLYAVLIMLTGTSSSKEDPERFKIQDSRMVYCNFNRNLHGIHSKTEAQVGLFVLNTIKLNCITLTSLVQQVSKVEGGVVPVIHVLYTVRVNNDNM